MLLKAQPSTAWGRLVEHQTHPYSRIVWCDAVGNSRTSAVFQHKAAGRDLKTQTTCEHWSYLLQNLHERRCVVQSNLETQVTAGRATSYCLVLKWLGACCGGFVLMPLCLYMLQYYALQILETVIKTRWKILPRNQCEGNPSFHAFRLFPNGVTCGCRAEECSSTEHAAVFSAPLALAGRFKPGWILHCSSCFQAGADAKLCEEPPFSFSSSCTCFQTLNPPFNGTQSFSDLLFGGRRSRFSLLSYRGHRDTLLPGTSQIWHILRWDRAAVCQDRSLRSVRIKTFTQRAA